MFNDHERKLRLMAKVEEKTNRRLWMHNTGYSEYFADKDTGDIVYLLTGKEDDEGYLLDLIALSS